MPNLIQAEMSAAVMPTINPGYHMREYDEMMMGHRKTYSSSLMAKERGPVLCAQVVRYAFEHYLHWSPTDARDRLSQEIIDTMKLAPLINRLPCPPELNRKTDLYFVAWHLYPETRTVSDYELIVKLYKDIIEDRVAKFPRSYFDGNAGYQRARLLFMIMLKEYTVGFESVEAMYAYFASEAGRNCINQYKLVVPLRELYGSPLAYLHDALPNHLKDEDLYEKYSKRIQRTRPTASYVPVTESELEQFEEGMYPDDMDTGDDLMEEELDEIEMFDDEEFAAGDNGLPEESMEA